MSCWMSFVGFVIGCTRRMPATVEGADRSIEKARAEAADPVPSSFKRKFEVRESTIGGFPVVTIAPKRLDTRNRNKALIYTHGGAYIRPITDFHWELLGAIVEGAGVKVVAALYPRAPNHTFEAAFTFMRAVYASVVEELGGASKAQIALAGDSAGGGLALALAQNLMMSPLPTPTPAPKPSGLILIAPWLDIGLSNPAISAVANDPWLNVIGARRMGDIWAGKKVNKEKAEPDAREVTDDYRVSPIKGPLAGLPPVDIFIGTRDILYPDCLLLADRLRAIEGGHAPRLRECAGAIHVYPLLPAFVPEAREGARQVVEAVRSWAEKNA